MPASMHSAQTLIEEIQSLPADRIVEVEDFVDCLNQRARDKKSDTGQQSLDFPVISVGKWPSDLSLSREDMYGNGGR